MKNFYNKTNEAIIVEKITRNGTKKYDLLLKITETYFWGIFKRINHYEIYGKCFDTYADAFDQRSIYISKLINEYNSKIISTGEVDTVLIEHEVKSYSTWTNI